MIKVAFNSCFGGFSLSEEATKMYKELGGTWPIDFISEGINYQNRHDPILIKVIETLGDKAGRKHSRIEIVEIPKEYENCYEINEYDGKEDVVCSPSRLVAQKLKELIPIIESISDRESKIILCELIQIIQNDEI